jgi:hypothetical protein
VLKKKFTSTPHSPTVIDDLTSATEQPAGYSNRLTTVAVPSRVHQQLKYKQPRQLTVNQTETNQTLTKLKLFMTSSRHDLAPARAYQAGRAARPSEFVSATPTTQSSLQFSQLSSAQNQMGGEQSIEISPCTRARRRGRR